MSTLIGITLSISSQCSAPLHRGTLSGMASLESSVVILFAKRHLSNCVSLADAAVKGVRMRFPNLNLKKCHGLASAIHA